MLLIAVTTVHYSPLTQLSCMITHKSPFHLQVTIRIRASDNLVTTDAKMDLEKVKKRDQIRFTPSLKKVTKQFQKFH